MVLRVCAPGERDPGLALASALPAPRPLYLDKSLQHFLLSQGGGRGTQWGDHSAGSPGGRPWQVHRMQGRGPKERKAGATPPHGSMSSHRVHTGVEEGRKGEGQVPWAWDRVH